MDYDEPTDRAWVEDPRDLRVRRMGAGVLLVAVILAGALGFMAIDPSAGLVRPSS